MAPLKSLQNAIFRQIAPVLRDSMYEVSEKKLFNEFQVAVRNHPLELGNTVFHLEESPKYKEVVGRLKGSDNAAARIAGYALELRRRKDGKTFKLTSKQRQEIVAAIKRRLRTV